ncbi:hypothetical protein ABPG74_018020 [Tetrahymena malaccensis]
METQNFYPEVELQDSTPKTNKTRVIDIRSNNKIVACAGSGKTTELILAIKKLIEQEKINPDEILVSTFNVESANHLKVKAQEKLQQYDAEKLRIQNIDKFAFEEYEKYLSQSKKMNEFKLDLKEIVLYVLNYLKTVEGKKNVLDQYKYLFFDEFQDINQTQYDILRLFIKNGCDDKQNIYSFRNSSSDFLQKYLNQDIPDLQTSNLKGEDLLPIVQVFQNENEQIEEIVKEIKGLRKFYSWNQMAILSPQRKSFTKFQEFLEKTNSDAKNNTKNEQSNEEDMIIPYYLADRQFNKIFSNENIELPKQQKGIMLSTIHTSKGLEWKAVFIIGIEDKEFPVQFAKQADNQNEKLNECRRMMYVSCTRAKKYLHLSFVEDQRKPYHLAYVHELKCKQKIITKIAFYNVISGKLFIFSLNEWNKEEQFYNFLKEKNVKLTEYKFPKKEQNTDQIQSLSLNEIKSSQNTLEKNDSQMQIESIAESQKQEQKCKEEDFETQTQILKSTNQNQIENINSSQTQQNFKNQDINEMEKLASCQGNAQKSQKTLEKNNTEQQNNRNQSQNNSGLADQISSQNKKRKQKMDDSYTEEYLTYLKNKKQKIDENQDNLVLFLIYIIAQCIIFFLFLEKKIRQ